MIASGTIITPQLEGDWLRDRRNSIGASDAAAAIGESPWKTPVELWQEKTGRVKRDDAPTEEMIIGKLLEPLAAGGGAALASGGHVPLSLAAAGAPIAVGRAARKIVSNKALVNHLIDSSLNGPGKFARRAPYAVPVAAQFLRGPLTKVIEDARRDERR